MSVNDESTLLTREGQTEPPSGMTLALPPVDGPTDSEMEAVEPLSLDVESIPNLGTDLLPLTYTRPDGTIGLNRSPREDDFSPEVNEKIDGDFISAIQYATSYQNSGFSIKDRRRAILREVDLAERGFRTPLPDMAKMSQISGMTESEYAHWQKRDPKRIANAELANTILKNSGAEGWVAQEAAKPHGMDEFKDLAILSELDAFIGEKNAGWLDQVVDSFAKGAKRVGTTGLGAVGWLADLNYEWTAAEAVPQDPFARQMYLNRLDRTKADADYMRRWANASEALTGRPMETESTLGNWSGKVAGTIPYMAGLVSLGIINPVAAGIAGGVGMAGDTNRRLYNEGVTDPLVRHMASAAVGGVSYITNKFISESVTRSLRSPLTAWGLNTISSGFAEAKQEFLEEGFQSTAEATAKLLGNESYTRNQWFKDTMSAWTSQAPEAGLTSALSTTVLRTLGIPLNIRNGIRMRAWAQGVEQTGNILSRTSLYGNNKAALAEMLDQKARFENNPFAFTSTALLQESGVTREIAIAEINEGGLGISPERYDQAAVTGEMVQVGQGTMSVFAQAQKDAGNANAADAFAIDPNSETIGDIKREAAESAAVVEEAAKIFDSLGNGDDSMLPKVLRTFRQGYRAAGFDSRQADAMIAMTHAGAYRNAELWGISEEDWILKHANLRIQIAQPLLDANRRQAKYFFELAQELWGETPQADIEAVPFEGHADSMRTRHDAERVEPAVAQPTQNVPEAVQAVAEAVSSATGTDSETVLPAVEQAVAEIKADPEAMAEIQQVEEAVREVETLIPATEPAPLESPRPAGQGNESEVIFPREAGIKPIPVRYALVEADALQPSHTPSTFAVNPAWPQEAVAQQRNYDSDAMAATRQSIQLDPLDFGVLFNPTTDAVNGSPIVKPDGLVLGGNNRTLRILNRYDQDQYKATLENELARPRNVYLGINPADVQAMRRPVLVRVTENVTPENVPALIGDLNRDFTTRRDAGNLAANRGARVGKQMLRAFQGIGDSTVSAYLDDPDKANRVMQAMLSEGVFQETDIPTMFNAVSQTWLPGGKQQVEQALFGAVLPDSRLLEEMTPAMQRKIMKALPSLIRLKNAGSPELADLFQAVRWHNEYQQFKQSSLGQQYKTDAARLEAFRKPEMADLFTGELPPEKSGAAWDMMLEISKAKSQKEVAEFFARKADEMTGVGRGLFSLAQGPAGTIIDDIVNKIRISIENDIHMSFGLRSVFNPGEEIDVSRRWDDDNPVIINQDKIDNGEDVDPEYEYLDGTSSIGIEADYYNFDEDKTRESVINALKHIEDYDGEEIVLIGGRSNQVGEDKYESVIIDAKPLYRTPNNSELIIESLYQQYGDRGVIRWEPDKTVIELFRNADTSTVVHELNHLFLKDMIRAYREGRGGERLAAHLNILNDFTGGKLLSSNAKDWEQAMERVASAWENWAMRGVAPSAALEEPFEVFRRYLTTLYGTFDERIRDAEPSEAVRRVFDAMLATDDEIAATSDRQAVRQEFEDAGLGTSAMSRAIDKQLRNRDERKRKAIDARRGGGKQLSKEDRMRKIRIGIRDEILKGEKGRVYRAIQLAKDKGGISRQNAVKLVGGETVQQIAVRHGEDVFGDRASAPQIAGQIGYGMTNDADMLSAMAVASPLDELVDAEVQSRVELENRAEEAQIEPEDVQAAEDGDGIVRDDSDPEIDDNDEEITDAREVAEAAVIDEVTEGGRRSDEPDTAKRLVDALAKFRNENAAAKNVSRETVYTRKLLEAKDVAIFKKLRTEARRKAREAVRDIVRNGKATEKDFSKLAQLRREELVQTYNIKHAQKALALNNRFKTKYSAVALKKLFDAPAKSGSPKAKIEYKYAVATSRLAIWSGIANSKYLLDKASDTKIKGLIPEAADEQLFGGELGFAAETPDWLRNGQKPNGFRDYRDFTVEEAFEIDRVMRYLIEQGRGKLNGIREDVARDLDEFKEKSLAPILQRKSRSETGKATANEWGDPNTVSGRMANFSLKYKNELLSPEFIFQMMDGNPTIHGKEMGFNQRYFWKQMSDAGVEKKLLIDEINQRNTEAYKVLSNFAKRWRKENKVGLWGGSGVMRAFGKDYAVNPLLKSVNTRTQNPNTILSFVLQTGNDANLRHLLSDSEFAKRFGYDPSTLNMNTDEAGNEILDASRYNYTNEDVAAFWAQLTAEEADAIQTIWDNNDFIYEAADKVHFELTNRHLTKEKAVPFTIMTAEGVKKEMRGGYAPIANNYQMNISQKGGTEADANKSILEGVSGRGQRNPGSLKSRLRNEQGIPMATTPTTLDLKVMFRHNNLMAHYISHAIPYRNLSRVVNDPEWSKAFTDRMGQSYYREIKQWLEENSIPPHSPNGALDRLMSFVRHRATIGILGYRLSSGMKQAMLGPTQALAHMSDAAGGNYAAASAFYAQAFAKFTTTSLSGIVGYNRENMEMVKAKSPYMRARDGGMDREVIEMRAQTDPLSAKFFGISMKQVDDLAMLFIQQGDRLATFTSWNAGYAQAMAGMAGYDMNKIRADAMNKSLNKGATQDAAEAAGVAAVEEAAVLYADSVARTQASSFTADLSAMQRSNSVGRYVAMFMSGNIRQASRVNQRIDDAILQGKPVSAAVDLSKFYVQEFVMPSLVNTLFNAGLKAAILMAYGLAPDDDDDILANLAWETAGNSVGYLPLARDVVSSARYGMWSLSGMIPATKFVADTGQRFVSAYKYFGKEDYNYALGNFLMGAGSVLGVPVMNTLAIGDLDRYLGLKRPRRGSSLAKQVAAEEKSAKAAAKKKEANK